MQEAAGIVVPRVAELQRTAQTAGQCDQTAVGDASWLGRNPVSRQPNVHSPGRNATTGEHLQLCRTAT